MKTTTYSRRDFLKTSGTVSGGLLISFFVPASAKRFVGKHAAADLFPNAYLNIAPDNTIKIILAHVEMGQGVWTTLPMLMAEELDCDWNKVTVEHAPPGKSYLHTTYGIQITGGSSSTWSEFDRYRNAGATARMMLIEAACKKFNVTSADCRTEKGFVIAGDKRASYGDLAEDAATLPAPPAGSVKLKDKKDWQLIGKATKRLDTKTKSNGEAMFGMDVHFPDMLIAVAAHAPVFGGTVKSFDATAAKSIKGVKEVVQIPTGVAVIADHFWAAKRGRDALKIDWNYGAGENITTNTQFAEYRKLAATKGITAAKAGDTANTLTKAAKKINAEYTFPYLAHAPMEPLNCTVKISGNKCEIWTGTQMPGFDQGTAAKILGISPEQVTVNTLFLGGGFGRRATPTSDFVAEAVHVAKASGKFIKLVWSREDDIRGGYYRPAFLHSVNIGIGTDGLPAAWQHRIVGQSIVAGTPFEGLIKDGVDGTSVEGVSDSPYFESIANHNVELHSPKLQVPVLWWRSVGHTHTAFVMETLIDELAVAAGKDPVAYRRSLLKSKRHLAALELAVEKSGWNNPLPAGQFRGVAVHESFGSYVAQVAEISITNGRLRVHKVTCAIDCGLAVNPEGVRAQMESGIIFGLTAVLYGEITLEKGRVKQRNFHDYKMLRMNETPVMEIHIVDSTEKMGGAGEPGVPPLAPAVVNAIFAATGKRIRRLPIQPEDLVKA